MKMSVKNPHLVDQRDTFQVGHGIILFGKRYLVEGVEYTSCFDDGVSLKVELLPYTKCDPALYSFEPIKPKKKRKPRTTSKKKRKR